MENNIINIMIGIRTNFLWKFGIHKAISNMPDYYIAGEYTSGASILNNLKKDKPKLLLLDQQLMDMSALELQQTLISQKIDIPILLIGDSNTSESEMIKFFNNGIKGYILNNCTEEQLIDAIAHVGRNKEWCSPTFSPRLFFSEHRRPAEDANKVKITDREHEILNLIVQGHNNGEISDLLCLSINTVQNHICNIYSKFGVRERLKAINFAKTHGLIEM